ncbi:MAG: GDSL-type esterase/lipase family protein [Flavobacteriaceae bacterium]|jgi:lysophospholipase L1-like esterase
MDYKILFFLFILNFSYPQRESLYPSINEKIKYQPGWAKKLYFERISEFKLCPLEFNQIVFIGNSITQGGDNWSEKFNMPGIRNRGIAGDTTDGLLVRLNEIIFYKPKAVFLLIGINDLYNDNNLSPKYIAKNIIKIVKKINKGSSESKIFIQTTLPVKKEKYVKQIQILNQYLKKYLKKGTFEIIDLYSQFTTQSGSIKTDLSDDGVHLNDKGYVVWANYIRPIIESLKEKNNL